LEKGHPDSHHSPGLCLFVTRVRLSHYHFFPHVFFVLDRWGTKMVVGSGVIFIDHIDILSCLFGVVELPISKGALGILGERNGSL
jgi:hypothetical protein